MLNLKIFVKDITKLCKFFIKDKSMKKKILNTFIFIIVLILPFCLVLLNNNIDTTDKIDIDSNIKWFVYVDGKKSNISFPYGVNASPYEETTIYATLPNDCENISILYFRSLYQSVTVRIEEKVIYEYNPANSNTFGLSMPRKLNLVNLPTDISGKEISISISSPYHKYSGYFSDAQIGESNEVVGGIFSKYSVGLTLSFILIFLNLAFILANYFFFRINITTPSIFYIFLSGLFVGVWLLGDSKLITLYISNHISNNLIYVSLICFIIIFAIFLKKTFKDKYKKLSNTMFIISIINMVVQYTLHFLKILDFVYLMPLNLILILIMYIIYTIYLSKELKLIKEQKNKVDLIYTIEFLMSLFICILTIINMILQNVFNYNMNSIIGIFYFFFVIVVYTKTVILVSKRAESSRVYKARLKETQNYLMQSQMKPHFIFNTLGAIRTLIMSNPKVAYEMTTNFSKYLRANISTIEPGEKIPFSQELDHIKAYVAIERERFKNRIMIIYDITCENFYLPPLSVEPLVENAIKHGICKKISGGTVKISSKEFTDRYEVIVEDDGVGFDTKVLETSDNTKSVGLKYIILRLKQVSNADFEITSEIGKGTKAVITVKK